MKDDVSRPDDARENDALLPRVFLREPGWQVGMKIGSEKTFCYQITPGEDFYHRLHDGEILVSRGEEKLCLPCAGRRGLLTFEPRILRDKTAGLDVEATDEISGYDVKG
jgi:hypothetical protein